MFYHVVKFHEDLIVSFSSNRVNRQTYKSEGNESSLRSLITELCKLTQVPQRAEMAACRRRFRSVDDLL